MKTIKYLYLLNKYKISLNFFNIIEILNKGDLR